MKMMIEIGIRERFGQLARLLRHPAPLLLLIAIESVGVSAPCLPFQVTRSVGNYLIPGSMAGIVYRREEGKRLEMDGYRQPGAALRPAVIVVHGGGWANGSSVSYVGQFLELLTKAGYNWFSIDYRMNGRIRSAESVSDLRAAVEFVRCHARELRVDSERIILLGEESGATMAAMVARDPAAGIYAQILIGGEYPLPEDVELRRMPKTLLIHGTDDREVPTWIAEQLCREMAADGHGCDYLPVEGASHRPENWWPSQWGYKEKMIAWLDRQSGIKTGPGNWRPRSYRKTQLIKDIVYRPELGLKLDAWVPGGKGPFPAVILLHGGGWEAGDKVTYLTPVMRPLAEAGFAWFSIDYRLTPTVRHEEQLADLRAAIRFVYREAERYNIDRRRIAILGESASGQMVAQIATEKMPEVAAVVSFYGVYDFLVMTGQFTPRSIPTRLFGVTDASGFDRLKRYSPLHQATDGMPPILLLCGTGDGLYRQHQSMVAKLTELKARFEAVELPGAPHGMENWEGHPEWASYKADLTAWLKRILN